MIIIAPLPANVNPFSQLFLPAGKFCRRRGKFSFPVLLVAGVWLAGAAAMLGYALLRPVSHNYLLLYVVGATVATIFEYLTGRLMLRLFGQLWWDYSDKPFNLYGQICPLYTIYWYFLCYPAFGLLGQIKRCQARNDR